MHHAHFLDKIHRQFARLGFEQAAQGAFADPRHPAHVVGAEHFLGVGNQIVQHHRDAGILLDLGLARPQTQVADPGSVLGHGRHIVRLAAGGMLGQQGGNLAQAGVDAQHFPRLAAQGAAVEGGEQRLRAFGQHAYGGDAEQFVQQVIALLLDGHHKAHRIKIDGFQRLAAEQAADGDIENIPRLHLMPLPVDGKYRLTLDDVAVHAVGHFALREKPPLGKLVAVDVQKGHPEIGIDGFHAGSFYPNQMASS